MRVPGGRAGATALAMMGFLTTSVSIVLACLPSAEEPRPVLAVAKIVGLSSGDDARRRGGVCDRAPSARRV